MSNLRRLSETHRGYTIILEHKDIWHFMAFNVSIKINGTYYVIQAIPDSQAKVMAVISAYMRKAGGNTDLELGMPKKGLQQTSKTNQGTSVPTINTNIPQNVNGVNAQDIMETKTTMNLMRARGRQL
jgi:hypothetical protein